MKRLLFLLPVLLFACNDQPGKPQDDMVQPQRRTAPPPMSFAALLPSGQQYDTLGNGDTIFYVKKDTTVNLTTAYSYKVERTELHPKKSTPNPEPVNKPPLAVAKATPSVITLPVSTIALSADGSSDPDGNIASYLWIKVSGPSAGTITATNVAATTATGLVEGNYIFRVTVTDNNGAEAAANVTVTVKPAIVVDPPTGTPIPISFNQVTTDFARPNAGIEQWHDRQDVNIGYQALDVYWRFPATRIAGTAKGSYNWNYLDNLFEQAKAKKQKISFGIMTLYPEGDANVGLVEFDGGYACYPQWLHQQMQSESVKDWRTGPTWTPNYNSPAYLQWLLDLNTAINAHIYAKGYQNMVNAIDIRGYGAWGEWHSGYTPNNVVSDYPSGTFPTIATLKKIVDAHLTGFPNFQLVCMIAAFDAGYFNNTKNPPEIAHYILTHKGNNAGPIGWRRDQWGATDGYIKAYLENNTRSFNGVVFKDLIMERWKTAPVTGEPPAWNDNDYSDLVRQIKLYHATSFGNGNYGTTINSTIQSRVKEAAAAAGAKLTIKGGSILLGETSSITLTWQNIGLCPTYDNWNVVFDLIDGSGNVKYTAYSKFKPRLFQPGATPTAVTDVIPTPGVNSTYSVRVKVVDAGGYRNPMPLAITGRNSDGSYTLK